MVSRSKKRMASDVLNVGKSRIKLDQESSELIDDAITRASIRGLIQQGVIWVAPERGISRGRCKSKQKRISKRGRGQGSRKGAAGARSNKKVQWITKIRALRKYLKSLKERGHITKPTFNNLYKQAGGGQVRSVRHLKSMVTRMRSD